MRTVHKYEIYHDIDYGIEIPQNGKVLTANMQNDRMYVWVDGDTQDCYVRVRFHIFGTGHEIDSELKVQFIATVFDGPFVWHVYEGERP